MIRCVFLDTDVLLDVILDRPPHVADSIRILGHCERSRVQGMTSALILANINYITTRLKTAEHGRQAVSTLRSVLRVCPLTDRELGEALASPFHDLEDAVQYFVAVNNGASALVTRNVRDFRSVGTTIPVLTPREALAQLSAPPGE